MRSRSILLFLIFNVHLYGQEDPLYWKNRKPYEGYWQQDVQYQIEATLDDSRELISGTLNLNYTNNSPQVVSELVFHLYQNAFEPNSYKNQFEHRQVKDSNYQHTDVLEVQLNDVALEYDIDNTIMRVPLPANQPLTSGESIEVTINFTTYFGTRGGRMKSYETFGNKHFNVVHWYPRIAVYDRKFGWTTDQHLGHEFYGDFGTFDVSITLPEHYVLDGTGILQNRSEVIPEELMKQLNIANFADKPWGEAPSEIIAPSAKIKTWVFHADHVHDFAWTADPSYRIGYDKAILKNGRTVDCYSLALEQHASGWQNAASYTARIIELYSKDFGEYAYPKMIVADARDGMEYPMLTLDGGRDPYYRDLLAHEVGHNWFFGMVGNNETYRASLDEGFTQFLTSWAMHHLEGDTIEWLHQSYGIQIGKKHYEDAMTNQVLSGYYRAAINDNSHPSLNTHSDHFDTRGGYGQVYYKTATMLYNLQYVLGDSLFLAAMKHYFNQWKFCHPYFEDFRASIIQFTGTDLNWFFDQWLESQKHIDYKVKSVKNRMEGTEITLVRKGDMQMPLALVVTDNEGHEFEYWIPNTDFVKSTKAIVLPKWYGWGANNTQYTVLIDSLSHVKSVEIDATGRLADVYQLNNSSPTKVNLRFDNLSYNRPTQNYSIEWRPSIWYNGFGGLKFGLEAHSGYYNTHHLVRSGIWYNSGLGQQTAQLADESLNRDWYRFDYRLEYETPIREIVNGFNIFIKSSFIDGLMSNAVGWRYQFSNRKTTLSHAFSSLYLPGSASLNYPTYTSLWNSNMWNNFQDLCLTHKYRYHRRSNGNIEASMRSPFGISDYQYGYLNLSVINDNRTKKINLRTRLFGQLGFGSNWAPESQLMLAGANAESISSNPLIRSMGFVPTSAGGFSSQTGWFHSGGGLNLRGFTGYLAPELNDDSLLRFINAGNSGIAFNTEFEFDDLIRILPSFKHWVELKTYLFADAGIININQQTERMVFSNLRMDAGLGTALEIKRWGDLYDIKPVTIRFDMPLFLNRPPANQEYFQYRWILALDRAF